MYDKVFSAVEEIKSDAVELMRQAITKLKEEGVSEQDAVKIVKNNFERMNSTSNSRITLDSLCRKPG